MSRESPHELLKIRLDALKLDVEKVKEVVNEARKRTDDIRAIRKRLGSEANSREPLRQLNALKDRVSSALQYQEVSDSLASTDAGLPWELKNQFPCYVVQLQELFAELERDIDELEHDMVDLPNAGPLQSSLGRRCNQVGKQIRDLKGNVENADPAAFGSLWNDFDELLKNQAKPLFAEYVEFAGGLAMRDNALEDRVCQMTDELLKELSDITKNALTVPARQAALSTIMTSVIKVGFPEWTVWGIPLAGHEAGLRIAEDDQTVNEHVEEPGSGLSKELRKSLFADIFATYTLGPAYACAAILLRFEPHHVLAVGDDPSDIDRAWLILKVLDSLGQPGSWNDDAEQPDSYFETVRTLRDLWEEAVVSLASQGVSAEPRADERPGIQRFLDETWGVLIDSSQFHPFSGVRLEAAKRRDRWGEAEKLVDYLLLPQAPGEAAQTPDLRRQNVIELLTAAWRARLADRERSTTRIARKALDLWRHAPEVGEQTPTRARRLERAVGEGTEVPRR
jgi:hypothetical protein